jgi:hypothetical protein
MTMGALVFAIALAVGVAGAWWFFASQNASVISWGNAVISQCQGAAVVDGVCHATIRVRN